jgi:hypothetical protein
LVVVVDVAVVVVAVTVVAVAVVLVAVVISTPHLPSTQSHAFASFVSTVW